MPRPAHRRARRRPLARHACLLAITGASATLTLRDYWYCPSISLSDSSTLNLERSAGDAAHGSISLTDSTASINTTFNNAGGTLSLSPSSTLTVTGTTPSPGIYAGATLTGGTIAGGGAVTLDFPHSTYAGAAVFLTDVSLAGGTNLVVASGTTAELRNSFSLGGGRICLVNDGATTTLHLDSLAGSGEIVFDGSSPSFSSVGPRTNYPPPDLPATFTIRTGAQGGYVLCGTMAGLISAQTPGKTLHFAADNVTGIVEARNGGTISLNTDPFHALFAPAGSGRVTLTSGTFNVYDGSSLVTLDGTHGNRVVANAAHINVSGPTAAAYDVLNYLESNTGSLSFTDGYNAITISPSLTNTGSITVGPSSSFRVNGALDNPGTISLASPTSALLIDYDTTSPLDAVRSNLLTGHVTTPLPRYSVAYADTAQLPTSRWSTTTWSPPDDTTLPITLTLPGDANLDGRITPDDYALLDRAYTSSLPDAHWTDGDFNYDGLIDQQDYLLIDQTLYTQAHAFTPAFLSLRESQFGAAYVQELLSTVPEPTSLIAVCGLALPLTRRRRT